eukprot:TRINITY_DN9828_c0_g1_i1.p1 TRINITY_DN9828_c0_g1~~TRINITY_DN9828_c0_g1_i1.p1  ORF type:complete len:195 (-),score=12.42 TRINITY_DN9828_c0_g1_i1:105-689(-)
MANATSLLSLSAPPVGSDRSCSSFRARTAKPQKAYMRSASQHNPHLRSPRFSENPVSTVTAVGVELADRARPLNRRTYFSPSFWIERVEKGDASRTAAYADYHLTNGFHELWQEYCEKEYHDQAAARNALAGAPIIRRASTAMSRFGASYDDKSQAARRAAWPAKTGPPLSQTVRARIMKYGRNQSVPVVVWQP